jgi:hypothetical protein
VAIKQRVPLPGELAQNEVKGVRGGVKVLRKI